MGVVVADAAELVHPPDLRCGRDVEVVPRRRGTHRGGLPLLAGAAGAVHLDTIMM